MSGEGASNRAPRASICPAHIMVSRSHREANSPTSVLVPPTFVEAIGLLGSEQSVELSRQEEKVQDRAEELPRMNHTKRPGFIQLRIEGVTKHNEHSL